LISPAAAREIGRRIKLVVCDLDGTLLNARHQISAGDLAAIRLANEKGIFVTVCSGRIVSMLEYYAKSVEIRGPLIAANGGHIIDTVSWKTLWEKPMDPEGVLGLLDFCRNIGMDYGVLSRQGCFFSPNSVRIQRFYRYNQIASGKGEREIPIGVIGNSHAFVREMKIDKVLIQQLKMDQLEQAQQFISRHTDFWYTSSEPGLLDVSAPGITKGEGVRRLAQIMNIPLEQTCAFGNYENDISMFSVVGLPIAMGNSSTGAKASALVVTRSNEAGGVGWGLRTYLL
jgi:Cof subfamily protein (haloacid dehalogenase superfamily)